MPLRPGKSKSVIATNMAELLSSETAAGRRRNRQSPKKRRAQAFAIAMRHARRRSED